MSRFFVYLFAVFAGLDYGVKIPNFVCFGEYVNKQQQNFILLSELEYGPLEFTFRRVCVHLNESQCKLTF